MSGTTPQRPYDPNIIRHTATARGPGEPLDLSCGDGLLMESVDAHFTKYVGEPNSVFHEVLSPLVHLDVHIVPPNAKHSFWTLFTTGCAERPMTLPPAVGPEWQYAELFCLLPADWQMPTPWSVTPTDASAERWFFPITWLKTFARLPHEYNTWIAPGHTMPNGDPAEPLAPGVPFTGVALLSPYPFGEDFATLDLGTRLVNFYMLVPLFPEEMAFKLEHGMDGLLKALEPLVRAHGFADLMNPARKCAIERKKRFWLF